MIAPATFIGLPADSGKIGKREADANFLVQHRDPAFPACLGGRLMIKCSNHLTGRTQLCREVESH